MNPSKKAVSILALAVGCQYALHATVAIDNPNRLWLSVNGVTQVPYIITTPAEGITQAIAQFNRTFAGVIQWVDRATVNPLPPDYVNFNLTDTSSTCRSAVGRVGGMQILSGGTGCNAGTLLHEMGHAIGLYHEQLRPDRDGFIAVQFDQFTRSLISDYDKAYVSIIGLYDYRSIMHYDPYTFVRKSPNTTVFDTIPAGIPVPGLGAYSEGDIDTIKRMYGAAPASVAITSNPPGLAVIVDGVTVTTGIPASVFNWPLGSAHTVDVSPDNQMLSGSVYQFGRWNDNGTRNHGIVVVAGDGSFGKPARAPAITVYTASFIEYLPYTGSAPQDGSGAAPVATPQPTTFGTGTYFLRGQAVSLQATPNDGSNFYDWRIDGSNYYRDSFSSGANPVSVRVFSGLRATYRNTTSQITTITTDPPGLSVVIDGTTYTTPKSFASDLDPAWTDGSTHTIAITTTPQLPDYDTRFVFASWSDNGEQSHSITADGGTYTATFRPQYKLTSTPVTNNFSPAGCSGAATLAPTSADGFYDAGTALAATIAPVAGFQFTGWRGDITGRTNPLTITMDDQKIVQPAFNTVADALTITGLTPRTVNAGTAAFTLTVNGAGFTNGTAVCFNSGSVCPTTSFVSPAQVTVPVTAALVASSKLLDVVAWNLVPAPRCCVASAPTDLPVTRPM